MTPTLPRVAGSSTPERQQPKMIGCQQWSGGLFGLERLRA